MEHQQTQASCKSVFKSGENTPLKKQFTKKWIELINRIEKNKRATGRQAVMTSPFPYGITHTGRGLFYL